MFARHLGKVEYFVEAKTTIKNINDNRLQRELNERRLLKRRWRGGRKACQKGRLGGISSLYRHSRMHNLVPVERVFRLGYSSRRRKRNKMK